MRFREEDIYAQIFSCHPGRRCLAVITSDLCGGSLVVFFDNLRVNQGLTWVRLNQDRARITELCSLFTIISFFILAQHKYPFLIFYHVLSFSISFN